MTPLGYRIVLLGDPSCPSGSYLLRIQTSAPDRFPFGRFRGGKEIFVPPGEYLYVGSALARRGGVSLARRLLRHASRSAGKPPHPIRDLLLAAFQQQGIGGTELLPRREKTLHWNVDHLLDRPTAELVGVYAVRSSLRMERELGQMIEQDAVTEPLEKGLGANDVRGNTHILRVRAGEDWWEGLPDRMVALLRRLQVPDEA